MDKQIDGQLAFDFDQFAREEARDRLDEWSGAPLRFTQDYYPPAAIDEAFDHWVFINGHHGSHARSHMWHRMMWNAGAVEFGDHRGEMFSAELRPEHGQEGPGGLLEQMVCEPCQWHAIDEDENSVVEQWHDHAVPGWRELPVVPASVRVRDGSKMTKLALAWIRERYPEHMQVPGAPIITERQPYGTRHVAGYSPWNGYDLSHTALDCPARLSNGRAIRRDVPPFTPARTASDRDLPGAKSLTS
ncbi:DUF6349 family protein [Microbacterium lacticum]|uniref:Uncharacterized protein n=1 Tax=Microbacterium lacticum TaxID=33885 RepID=A0A4Y3USK0_9MICO|nr:DUF6349 family protein [Microbacterium lacticum]TQN00968.1 hypothetical protein FHX68_1101 [Microbacterium lacticum]GEB96478.1 hypothetical protein MLA01_26970 [Microbacterium lacticum]GGI74889.1 hypothetical protein GCM10009724_27270 [Microbacterium lacticum]